MAWSQFCCRPQHKVPIVRAGSDEGLSDAGALSAAPEVALQICGRNLPPMDNTVSLPAYRVVVLGFTGSDCKFRLTSDCLSLRCVDKCISLFLRLCSFYLPVHCLQLLFMLLHKMMFLPHIIGAGKELGCTEVVSNAYNPTVRCYHHLLLYSSFRSLNMVSCASVYPSSANYQRRQHHRAQG